MRFALGWLPYIGSIDERAGRLEMIGAGTTARAIIGIAVAGLVSLMSLMSRVGAPENWLRSSQASRRL